MSASWVNQYSCPEWFLRDIKSNFVGSGIQTHPWSDTLPLVLFLHFNLQNSNKLKRRRTIYKMKLGWLIWTVDRQKYTQVRLKTGGGCRDVEFVGEADSDIVLDKAKQLFFPNGNSIRVPHCQVKIRQKIK